jgi:hypothetical protein
MTAYNYPLVAGGYRWNLLQRIYNTIGILPDSVGDVGEYTVLQFSEPLSEQDKSAVDAIMADDPQQPPTTENTVFSLLDVWNRKEQIADALGLPYDLYYSESVPGSGDVDTIEIHFKKVLNEEELQRVWANYPRLLTHKQ